MTGLPIAKGLLKDCQYMAIELLTFSLLLPPALKILHFFCHNNTGTQLSQL
jgi:hypothetical protein